MVDWYWTTGRRRTRTFRFRLAGRWCPLPEQIGNLLRHGAAILRRGYHFENFCHSFGGRNHRRRRRRADIARGRWRGNLDGRTAANRCRYCHHIHHLCRVRLGRRRRGIHHFVHAVDCQWPLWFDGRWRFRRGRKGHGGHATNGAIGLS